MLSYTKPLLKLLQRLLYQLQLRKSFTYLWNYNSRSIALWEILNEAAIGLRRLYIAPRMYFLKFYLGRKRLTTVYLKHCAYTTRVEITFKRLILKFIRNFFYKESSDPDFGTFSSTVKALNFLQLL